MTKAQVTVGITTIVGLAVGLLGVVPTISKLVQDGQGITVNGPERWAIIAGIVGTGTTVVGRQLQKAVGAVNAKVSIYIGTATGWIIAAVGLVPIVCKVVQEGQGITVNGPERWAALAGIISLGLTNMGRYLIAVISHLLSRGEAAVAARPMRA